MESRITSKCEKEQMFLEIKENKSYILTPWEASGFHGVLLFIMVIKFLQSRDFIVNSVFLLAGYILSNQSDNIKSGAVPKEKINQIYQEILALHPYNLELY